MTKPRSNVQRSYKIDNGLYKLHDTDKDEIQLLDGIPYCNRMKGYYCNFRYDTESRMLKHS